jgi:murein DD-endopeptidase MepM/ murein hydrolase activator NlpD
LSDELRARGIVVVSGIAGERPDAVLVLAGSSEAAGQGVWYCDAPRANASALAGVLATAVPTSGTGAPSLDCQGLELPRTPIAVVQSGASDAASARGIAVAVYEYFSRHGGAQRRVREAARLTWPASGAITSEFGPSHPLGIDIGQWSGAVRAASDGVVYFAGGDACCSYGRFVVIDGADGVRTLYAHLETLAVKTGDRVKAGQALGEVGCTGACHGAHLHFEVIDSGVRRDPLTYLPR